MRIRSGFSDQHGLNEADRIDGPGQTVADCLLQLAHEDSASLYAVVDAARSDEVLSKMSKSGVESLSLFAGSKTEEKLYAVSPLLVVCVAEDEYFEWLTSDVWGNGYAIFLTCADTFVNLTSHLRRFLHVRWEEKETLYFRFYDPRVLRTYLPTCTTEELSHFYGLVKRFLVESESGDAILNFSRHDANAGRVNAPGKPVDSLGRLIIRDEQMRILAQQSTKDFENRAAKHLGKFFPEQCAQMTEAQIHEVINYGIQRSRTYGIISERDVCKYLDLMFVYGVDFDKNPEFPWAARVLNDPKYPNATARIDDLHSNAIEQLRGVADAEGKEEA